MLHAESSVRGPLRTRLAPSPTGALHLGNARTFLVNWALARQRGWQIVLRMDDLDGPRIKPGADRESIDLLSWLGLDWDEGPVYQTQRFARYREVLGELARSGCIYPCGCTRSDVQAASLTAPHSDTGEVRYPGTCRPPAPTAVNFCEQSCDDKLAWRLRVPTVPIQFSDQVSGPQAVDVDRQVGDFLVATRGGQPSYQLAVVVDDADQAITDVVRGDDLLASTARQLLLFERLQLAAPQRFWHLPLVRGADGRRLAKRHGDSRLVHYRAQGRTPQQIIGQLAGWCGIDDAGPMDAQEFLQRFQLDRLPRHDILCSATDVC